MQVILLFLLTTFAFAQKHNPVIQCDPKEAERDCYNLICETTDEKLIPLETAELSKAFKAHPFVMPENFNEELAKVGAVAENIRTNTRKKLTNNELSAIASEIMANPFEHYTMLKAFFGGELKCVEKNLQCDLVSNDLSAYPEGMKSFYKIFYDKALVFVEGATLTIEAKKSLLLKAIEEVKGSLSKDDYKKETKAIKKMKREVDFLTYSMNAPWILSYKQKVNSELKINQKDLEEALRIRTEDYLKYDLASAGRIAYVKRTCQLGSYIQDTINAHGTVKKFDEYRTSIINSFRTKFLPTLSESTAKELSAALTPDSFVLLENQANIYPPKFSSVHDNGYKEPQTASQFMSDLMILQRGEAVKCNTGGKLVSDHFNPNSNKLFISKYVLANSFPDILTHELGHWLSSQIGKGKLSSHSKKKLMNVRKCVTSFYDEKSEAKYAAKLKGDHFRTEEDFADWFVSKSGIAESGVFCDLKKMVNSNELDNYLPQKYDSHSNYLFRDLNIRLNKGEILPQSCTDLMNVYPESRPEKCDL